MRISDWSSDVCSSDLKALAANSAGVLSKPISFSNGVKTEEEVQALDALAEIREMTFGPLKKRADIERSFSFSYKGMFETDPVRSEEHTSELQSLMRISYAVFCLKKKNTVHSIMP